MGVAISISYERKLSHIIYFILFKIILLYILKTFTLLKIQKYLSHPVTQFPFLKAIAIPYISSWRYYVHWPEPSFFLFKDTFQRLFISVHNELSLFYGFLLFDCINL